MNEETEQILRNQKLILRCFLYDERVVIKDEIYDEIIAINNLLFPKLKPTLPERTKDALSEKNAGEEN